MEKPVLLYNPEYTLTEWQKAFSGFLCCSALKEKPKTPLVRWGNSTGADNPVCTLNRKRALLNALNRQKSLDFLRLNRVRRPQIVIPGPSTTYPVVAKNFNPKDRPRDRIVNSYKELSHSKADFYVQYVYTLKDYRAWVFNAEVFHLEIKVPVKSNTSFLKLSEMQYYEPIPADLDADSERVSHLAIKAVHLTGLDFAEVRVGIDRQNRPVVLDISPILSFNQEVSKKFIARLQRYCSNKPGVTPLNNILLGADPEFILRDQLTGSLVFASTFLEKEGLFGYDERSEGRKGELYPLAEIRPSPDPCPLRLTEKIKFALEQGLKKIPYQNIEWLAGSIHYGKYQIGGHIHYSGIEVSSALLRALDNYLGIIVSLMEDHQASAQRRRQYGGLGNIRTKPHGGFEYRTLGSWLVTPKITLAVLCLAKVVSVEYWDLKRDYFVSYEIQRAFYRSDRKFFYEIFPLLWKDITNTGTYRKYKSQLRIIPEMISKGQTWDERQDIRKTWKLPIPEQVLNIPVEGNQPKE